MESVEALTGPIFSKHFLGGLSVVLTLVAYIPYFVSIVRRQTRPHLFSWIIWSVTNGTAFFAQYSRDAGAGAWATGLTTCLTIALIGFSVVWGEKDVTRSDWAALFCALFAIALWYMTDDPLWSVLLVSLIDIVGCYPTLRKSYNKPWQESALSYGICGVRSGINIIALEQYSFVTVTYHVALLVSNGLLTFVLLWRRSVVKKTAAAGVVHGPM